MTSANGEYMQYPPMTRIEAEQMAYAKSRNDPEHHYVAQEDKLNGGWKVAIFNIHLNRYASKR